MRQILKEYFFASLDYPSIMKQFPDVNTEPLRVISEEFRRTGEVPEDWHLNGKNITGWSSSVLSLTNSSSQFLEGFNKNTLIASHLVYIFLSQGTKSLEKANK